MTYRKAWYRQYIKERTPRWYAAGKCVICGHERNSKEFRTCSDCREKAKGYGKAYRKSTFEKVLEHYGRACVCCGEDNPAFLTLDHMNNDGAAHKRSIGVSAGGQVLYKKLEKLGWPEGLQILCFNCNCGKLRNNGVCPHNNQLLKAAEGDL